MTDASEGGCGVCCSTWPEEVVSEVGRVGERSRFRRVGPHSARAGALTAAAFRWDADTQVWMVNEESPELERHWQIAGDFAEVPAGLCTEGFGSPFVGAGGTLTMTSGCSKPGPW